MSENGKNKFDKRIMIEGSRICDRTAQMKRKPDAFKDFLATHVHKEMNLDRRSVELTRQKQQKLMKLVLEQKKLLKQNIVPEPIRIAEVCMEINKERINLVHERIELIKEGKTCAYFDKSIKKAMIDVSELDIDDAPRHVVNQLFSAISRLQEKRISNRGQTDLAIVKNMQSAQLLGDIDVSDRAQLAIDKLRKPTKEDITLATNNARKIVKHSRNRFEKVISVDVSIPNAIYGFSFVTVEYESINARGIPSRRVDSFSIRFSDLVWPVSFELRSPVQKITTHPGRREL